MDISYSKVIVCLCVFLFSVSCNAQNSSEKNTTTTGKTSTVKPAQSYVAGKDYIEFERQRVLDRNGFAQPIEAASFLVPKGWKVDGNIIWTLPGQGCEGTNQQISITSSDGKMQIKFNPLYTWTWSNDPTLNQMSQQTARQGSFCIVGQPMDAESFVRNAVLPQLPGGTQLVKMDKNNNVASDLKAKVDAANRELQGYGAGQINNYFSAVNSQIKFPDGNNGIIMVGMINSEMNIPNPYTGSYNVQYSGSLNNYITFKYPANQEEQAKDLLAVIVGSIRVNPDWLYTVNLYWKNFRAQRNVEHIGRIQLMDAQTKQMAVNHQNKMAAKNAAFAQHVRSWESTQQTNDKIHNNFIKSIREVDNFRDATGTVEMSSHYNHAWSRNDGSSFIMTNNPNLDPAAIFQDQHWKPMQKVD